MFVVVRSIYVCNMYNGFVLADCFYLVGYPRLYVAIFSSQILSIGCCITIFHFAFLIAFYNLVLA
jgi:hypothetical protein